MQVHRAKDTLIIIATSLTILINISIIVGGLKWFMWVTETLDRVTIVQGKVLDHLEEIDRWQHQHELYSIKRDRDYQPPRK